MAPSPTLPARSIQLVPSSSMGRCSCICQGEKAHKMLYFESNDDCKSGSCLQGAGFLMLRRAVPRVGWRQAHRFPADGSSPFLLPLFLFPGRFSAGSSCSRPGVPRSRCCSCGEEWHCVPRSQAAAGQSGAAPQKQPHHKKCSACWPGQPREKNPSDFSPRGYFLCPCRHGQYKSRVMSQVVSMP